MRAATGPVLAGVVAVVAMGVVHGVSTDRWRPSGELEAALAGLDRVPARFGDWAGEDLPYEPAEMARAGIQGCVFRRYHNPRTRETVSVLLVCGRGGPISVHTPDVCYAGAGYRQVADERLTEVEWDGGTRSAFWVLRFAKLGGVVPTQLEVSWAWSRDGRTWEAPKNPRLVLARAPALYKLYVVREFVPGGRAEAADTGPAFLRQALPELRRALPPTAPE
jgi:hypothetical protein